MDTKTIKEWFESELTKPEHEFLKLTGFKELKFFDVSGRDDWVEIYIGRIENRFFWYKTIDGNVWYDDWDFLDELPDSQ